INAVNSFDRAALFVADLEAVAAAITRVGEVNASLGIDGQVVGFVEALALIALGERRDFSIELRACNAAQLGFAGQQSARGVEQQAIGTAPRSENPRLAVAVELADLAVPRSQDSQLGVPCRPLPADAAFGL